MGCAGAAEMAGHGEGQAARRSGVSPDLGRRRSIALRRLPLGEISSAHEDDALAAGKPHFRIDRAADRVVAGGFARDGDGPIPTSSGRGSRERRSGRRPGGDRRQAAWPWFRPGARLRASIVRGASADATTSSWEVSTWAERAGFRAFAADTGGTEGSPWMLSRDLKSHGRIHFRMRDQEHQRGADRAAKNARPWDLVTWLCLPLRGSQPVAWDDGHPPCRRRQVHGDDRHGAARAAAAARTRSGAPSAASRSGCSPALSRRSDGAAWSPAPLLRRGAATRPTSPRPATRSCRRSCGPGLGAGSAGAAGAGHPRRSPSA